jgi:hypothetical protein
MILPTLEAIDAEQNLRAKRWKPWPDKNGVPHPQRMAMETEADILFYGGAAGGGKTDLLLGTARYAHTRSIIFRRVSPSLQGIIDRSKEIYVQAGDGDLTDYNEGRSRWKFRSGAMIRFGSMQYDSDVTDHQGVPYDLYGFDEITEFTEKQFRFVTGWNRSTKAGQRCRVICTGNPPTDSDGEWVLRYWGPWLDPNHPHPALPGELRWYTTIEGEDVECPSGDPVEVNGEMVKPLSRTFIPAKVQDNPALMASGYITRLQALPEPLRSKMLYGDFLAGREDNAYQVIPSAWVEAAMERWKTTDKPKVAMTALGVDVARGGKDKTCLAPRYLNWFDKVKTFPGKDTPDGQSTAMQVLLIVRDQAQVVVDVIGVGSSAYDSLAGNEMVDRVAYAGSAASHGTDKSKTLKFINKRAEDYWKFREALDPANQEEICLPPDPELKADLCAPRWKPMTSGIQIEPKDCGQAKTTGGTCCVKHRIGRSPDKGDAVVMAASVDVKVPKRPQKPKNVVPPTPQAWMA